MGLRNRIFQFAQSSIREIFASRGGVLFGRGTGAGQGQEIIIGEGLTLADGTLSATPAEGTVLYDDDGNITTSGIAVPTNTLSSDLDNLLHYKTPQGGHVRFKALLADVTQDHTYTFPDQDGTVAMVDQIVPVKPGAVGRYAGIIAAGPPSVGTFEVNDWLQTQNGEGIWTCLEGGTPGKWVSAARPNLTPDAAGAMKADWGNVSRYPGKVSASSMSPSGNRIIAAPYLIPEDAALSSIRFEILTGCHAFDTNAKIQVAIYEDFHGAPGELIWESAKLSYVAVTSVGMQQASITPPVNGGRWIWIAFRALNIAAAAGTLRCIESSPYEIRTGVIDGYYYPNDAAVAVFTDKDAVLATDFPVSWPEVSRLNRVASLFPVVWFNFRANTDRLSPYRFEPDRMPIMLPRQLGDACQEPNMWYDPRTTPPNVGERYTLIFSAGWVDQNICWATGPTVDGPFTRRGYFGSGGRGSIYYENGILYHFQSENSGVPGGPIKCRFGPGPESFGAPVNALSGLQAANPNFQLDYMNSTVIKRGPNDYVMHFDGADTVNNPGIWQCGMATATAPQGPYTVTHWPLTTLRHPATPHVGHTSAGTIIKVGSVYHNIYHGAYYGNLPSEIFHATSTDLENWTPSMRRVAGRKHPYEYDQKADPFFFEDPETGNLYLFTSAVENETPSGCIIRSNPNKLDLAALLGL